MATPNFILSKDLDIGGTCLQGRLEATYKEIVDILGPPNSTGDDYKIDAEWLIQFEDGTIATIHNYKNGKNYLGAEGLATEDITEWSIGGHNDRAAYLVMALIYLKE